MILRIFRAPVRAGLDQQLDEVIREHAVIDALSAPGLLSVQSGVRSISSGTELIVVSTWTDIETLVARRLNLDTPVALPSVAPLLEGGHADHYEQVVGGARAMPIVGSVLRVLRARIRPNTSAVYFDRARRAAAPFLDSSALVALHVGRRIEAGVEEAVSVSVWADAAALDGIVGGDRDRPIGDAEVDELLLAPPTIEHFDAVTVTRDRPDAPALLLADDERRFVYATPAAAQLMGRSLSRLLTMRVEDLAAPDVRDAVPEMWSRFLTSGSMEGAFNLARPDGSEFKVTFSARAGVPWPGCHTSVMTPDAPAAAPDIDEALAAAGVVARYTTGI